MLDGHNIRPKSTAFARNQKLKISSAEKNRLSAEETAVLVALRQQCGVKRVEYKNTFELAKYAIIAIQQYPEGPRDRQVQFAFQQLLRAYETIHSVLDSINHREALGQLLEIDHECFLPCGVDNNGCRINAFCFSHKIWNWLNVESANNRRKLYTSALLEYFSLALPDLEDTRKGEIMLFKIPNADSRILSQMILLVRLSRISVSKCFATNLKALYAIIDNNFVGSLVSNVVPLLPSPIRKSTVVGQNVEELMMKGLNVNRSQLHPELGGYYSETIQDLLHDRTTRLENSLLSVRLDEE